MQTELATKEPAPEPTPPGAPSSSPAATNPGMAKLRARFKACYLKGLEKDPSLTGAPSIKFTVDPQGKVTSAKVVCTKWPKELTECIRKAVLDAELDKDAPGTFTVGGPC
jgi:hypothetical protein